MTMKDKLVLRIHRESPVKAIQQRVTRQHEQCMEGASVRWRTIVLGSSRSGVPAVARRRQPSGATPVHLPDFGRRFDTKSLAWALIRKGIHEVSIAAEARRRVVIKSTGALRRERLER